MMDVIDNKGPRLNKFTTNFTTRDSLGVESVASSISGELCPIINTVTPRPFYWAFMCFIYYDYYRSVEVEKRDYKSFDQFLKRHDYYFVLSQVLFEASDQANLAGTRKAIENISKNEDDLFSCDRTYFKAQFGGMQYFNAGLFAMGFIHYRELENGKQESFPHLTGEGKTLACAFESVICETEFFKKYRLKEVAVPKDVLIEYGKKINLALHGFDECKSILKASLFSDRVHNMSYNYALFLNEEGIYLDNVSIARNVLYDYYSPRGDNKSYPKNLSVIVKSWEVVVGRQYFAAALEMIWRFMLLVLERSKTKDEWILYALEDASFLVDLDAPLDSMIDECNYDYATREAMIKKASTDRKNANLSTNIEDGLRILLSLYQRFYKREDFSEEVLRYLYFGYPVSISELLVKVDEYRDKPIREFLMFIMEYWLIKHHYDVALEKLYAGNDGFYYEIIDGYYHKKEDFNFAFQGIRFVQLMQVMKDLEIISGGMNRGAN